MKEFGLFLRGVVRSWVIANCLAWAYVSVMVIGEHPASKISNAEGAAFAAYFIVMAWAVISEWDVK